MSVPVQVWWGALYVLWEAPPLRGRARCVCYCNRCGTVVTRPYDLLVARICVDCGCAGRIAAMQKACMVRKAQRRAQGKHARPTVKPRRYPRPRELTVECSVAGPS